MDRDTIPDTAWDYHRTAAPDRPRWHHPWPFLSSPAVPWVVPGSAGTGSVQTDAQPFGPFVTSEVRSGKSGHGEVRSVG